MSKPSTSSSKKTTKKRYNRAERRAMQVRAQDGAAVIAANAGTDASAVVASSATAKPGSKLASYRPIPLSRAEEYSYIESDLRRLLITAGSLLALMLVLLFVVD